MGCLKSFLRKVRPNPLERILQKAKGPRFLICWNRGLGDIALGLYAMVLRIRTVMPAAEITFLTRPDLQEGFTLLEGVKTIACEWERHMAVKAPDHLSESFDVVIENPDPTYWVKWQIGTLTPRLAWRAEYDAFHRKFNLPVNYRYIAVQVAGESGWGEFRAWPIESWRRFCDALLSRPDVRIILLGKKALPPFDLDNVVDLRGKTSVLEALSVIKNCAFAAVLPDSGLLSLLYYLDCSFPLRLISLWADPRQGILKQKASSPNNLLDHLPLIGENEIIANIKAEVVLSYV